MIRLVLIAVVVAVSKAGQGHPSPTEVPIPEQPYIYATGSPQQPQYAYDQAIPQYYIPYNYQPNYSPDASYYAGPAPFRPPSTQHGVHHKPTPRPVDHHGHSRPQLGHTAQDFLTDYSQYPQYYHIPSQYNQYPHYQYLFPYNLPQQYQPPATEHVHPKIPTEHRDSQIHSIKQIVNRPVPTADEIVTIKPKSPKLDIPIISSIPIISQIAESIKLPTLPSISEIVKIPGEVVSQTVSQIGKITEGLGLSETPEATPTRPLEAPSSPQTAEVADISGGSELPHLSSFRTHNKPEIVRPSKPVVLPHHTTPKPAILPSHPAPKPTIPRPHHHIPEHHHNDVTIPPTPAPEAWFPTFSPEVFSTPDHVTFAPIRTTFTCDDRIYGYYADIDNECEVYHICHQVVLPGGELQNQRISFRCGPGTVFSQLKRTCVHPDGEESCADAATAYSINDDFGIVPEVPINLEAQTNTFASLEPLNQRIKDGLKSPNSPFRKFASLFPQFNNDQPKPSGSVDDLVGQE